MTKPPRIRSSLRQVVRVLLWSAAVLALAVGGGLWMATRSWFIIARATPVLEERLGGDVTIGHARYLGRGFFEFEDLRLRVRTLQGDAAEVARIGLARVEVDADRLIRGEVQVERVGLEDLLLRISEDRNDSGNFNFMGLVPQWDRQSTQTTLPARISIRNAKLQMGVHVRGGYATRGERRLSGVMQTLGGEDRWFQFLLHEIDNITHERVADGLTIGGRWNATTYEYEAQMNAIVLDAKASDMCPQNVRLWWERMEPEGRVANAKLRWAPRRGMTLELDLDVFALTFPIEAEDIWVRYRDGGIGANRGLPRMRVQSGRIVLDSSSLEFRDLVGVLGGATSSDDDDVVGVPYRVSARIGSLSSFSWERRDEWMEQVLATAPFWVHLNLDDFSLQQRPDGRSQAVELPLAVARVLQTFRMTGWNLTTEIEVRRGPPSVDPETGELSAGDTFTWGEACIDRGAGAYERFPYRLEDITAHIEFDDDFVKLHDIHGYGSGDAVVEVSGEIRSIAHGDISMHLRANDIELDERLAEALQPEQRRAFEAFLSQSSRQALVEAGLLTETGFADVFADLPPVVGRPWPFRLGGRVDMDFTLTREGGYESPTVPTGRLDIDWIGVLYEGFPYPVTVSSGSVIWDADRLHLVGGRQAAPDSGITLLTPGGGRGTIRGEVRLDTADGVTTLRPSVSVDLVDDSLNELLYAAVPLSEDEKQRLGENVTWPGQTRTRVADFMREVFRSGDLSYHGTIDAGAEGDLQYDFEVDLQNASASPTEDFASAIGAPEAIWPEGFEIRDGEGRLRVTPDGIELKHFRARHGTGEITASGTVTPDQDGALQTRLNVDFDQLQLGPYVLQVVPDQWSQRVDDLWSRYQPEGSFRAELDLERTPDGHPMLAIRLTPEELRLVVDERPLELRCTDGYLLLQRGRVSPQGLVLDARIGDQDGGRFKVHERRVRAGDAADSSLELTWEDGAFESPLIQEALRVAGAAPLIEEFEELQPFGRFTAHLEYAQPDVFGRGGFRATFEPATLGLQLEGTPILAEFEPGSEVIFEDGVITLRGLRAAHGGGVVAVDGRIDTNGATDVDVDLSSEGPIRSDELWAMLPPPVRTVLDGIDYQDGEAARLVNGHLRLTKDESLDGLRRWRIGFDGRVETEGANVDVGLAIKDLDGAFEISLAREPGLVPRVEVLATATSMQAGRDHLTDVVAPIHFAPDGRSVLIPEFRADLYGGALAANLAVGIHENKRYDMKIDIVGASLQEMYHHLSASEDDDPEAEPSGGPEGTIFANVSITGERGREGSRVGRGAVRIMEGKFAKVLFSLRVMQVLQLTLPLQHDYFDFASLDFYLEDDRVVFDDEILLESGFGDIASLQLLGKGWMHAETFELNTRFRIRTGMLVLRDLAGGLSDGLFVIELTGPIFEPKVSIIPLPGINAGQPAPSPARARRAASESAPRDADAVVVAGERPPDS